MGSERRNELPKKGGTEQLDGGRHTHKQWEEKRMSGNVKSSERNRCTWMTKMMLKQMICVTEPNVIVSENEPKDGWLHSTPSIRNSKTMEFRTRGRERTGPFLHTFACRKSSVSIDGHGIFFISNEILVPCLVLLSDYSSCQVMWSPSTHVTKWTSFSPNISSTSFFLLHSHFDVISE